MELLVIGGTMFLGRHLVEDALAAGHRVTLFNRGGRTRRCSRTWSASRATGRPT